MLRVLIVIACQWAQACAWSMRSVVSCLCLVVSVVCVPAPRQSTKDTAGATLGRKKDRSRSKSPFRSFRWKKSSPKSPTQTSASDDEGNLERAAGNEHNPSSFESLLIVSLGIVYLNTFFTLWSCPTRGFCVWPVRSWGLLAFRNNLCATYALNKINYIYWAVENKASQVYVSPFCFLTP